MKRIKMTINAVVCNFDGNQAPRCEKGATFEFPFEWEDGEGVLIDLSGYTAKMQVRDGKENIIIELSMENERIFLDSAQTLMTLYISGSDTGLLHEGRYSYDLFLYDENSSPSKAIKLLKGVFEVEASVTV